MTTSTEYVLKRLQAIEAELAGLRKLLAALPAQEPLPTLEGIWEGAEVTDEDIEEAKRSLFRPAYDDSV